MINFVNLCVVKILASGCYNRFMWVFYDGKHQCIRINDDLYQYLKRIGVPTSQKLRFK